MFTLNYEHLLLIFCLQHHKWQGFSILKPALVSLHVPLPTEIAYKTPKMLKNKSDRTLALKIRTQMKATPFPLSLIFWLNRGRKQKAVKATAPPHRRAFADVDVCPLPGLAQLPQVQNHQLIFLLVTDRLHLLQNRQTKSTLQQHSLSPFILFPLGLICLAGRHTQS